MVSAPVAPSIARPLSVASVEGSAFKPLICILTIVATLRFHDPEPLSLQYLMLPMDQPGAPPSSSSCEETR